MNEYLIDYPINMEAEGIFRSDKKGNCVLNAYMNKHSLHEFNHLTITFGVNLHSIGASVEGIELLIKNLTFSKI